MTSVATDSPRRSVRLRQINDKRDWTRLNNRVHRRERASQRHGWTETTDAENSKRPAAAEGHSERDGPSRIELEERKRERERETERLMGRDKQTHKIRANNGGADKDKETLYHSPVVSQEAPIREKMKVC